MKLTLTFLPIFLVSCFLTLAANAWAQPLFPAQEAFFLAFATSFLFQSLHERVSGLSIRVTKAPLPEISETDGYHRTKQPTIL